MLKAKIKKITPTRVWFFAVLFVFVGVTVGSSISQAGPIIGNPNAPVGGTFRLNLTAEPSVLNPLKGSDGYTSIIAGYVYDSLLDRNPETYEFEPALAEKFEESKDGRTITFTLREGATFHDGSPVTIEDVAFSFEAYRDPKLVDAAKTIYFENFEKVEIVDPKTIRFVIKKKYFNNLNVAGGMAVLPKKYYSEPGKKMNKTMVGSGPYKLENYTQGQKIVLKRNDQWWGFKVDQFKGYNKFDRIVYTFIKDKNAEFEAFKKGDLDFVSMTPETFEKKTDGPLWGTKVQREAIENKTGKPYMFLAFNLTKPIFKEKEVREALSQLFNREMMIDKFFYGKYLAATGPWYVQSEFADPNVKAVKYDPTSARDKLKKAGWVDENKDGVLEKNIDGKKTEFRISLIHPGGEWEKYLTIYKEELKKSGIDLELKQLEWNAFQKNLDDRNFDMVGMVWSSPIDLDPKQIWHSSSSANKGSNFISYSNPKVDQLIDQVREEMDKKKRTKILREIYGLIAADHPYIFLFVPRYGFYGYNTKLDRVKPTYPYGVIQTSWWFKNPDAK